METEHEKLKEICDEIDYINNRFEYINYWESIHLQSYIESENSPIGYRIIDVREIIFTKEFWGKYIDYRFNNSLDYGDLDDIFDELDTPVEFLYNLLELGKKN